MGLVKALLVYTVVVCSAVAAETLVRKELKGFEGIINHKSSSTVHTLYSKSVFPGYHLKLSIENLRNGRATIRTYFWKNGIAKSALVPAGATNHAITLHSVNYGGLAVPKNSGSFTLKYQLFVKAFVGTKQQCRPFCTKNADGSDVVACGDVSGEIARYCITCKYKFQCHDFSGPGPKFEGK